VSTWELTFWIFAHSPLLITERHRHSFDVFPDVNRKVPFGAGATLSYNYIDFRVKNNTENTFKINFGLKTTIFWAIFSLEKLNSTLKLKKKPHCKTTILGRIFSS
jgi:vancomycin resistance protein VanW